MTAIATIQNENVTQAPAFEDDDFDLDDADFELDADDDDMIPAKPGRGPSEIDLRYQAAMRIAQDLPDDDTAMLDVARRALTAFDEAIRAEDMPAMTAASDQYQAVVWKMNGGTFSGCETQEGSSNRIRFALTAEPGKEPIWGQRGEFLVDVAGVRVVVVSNGGTGGLSLRFCMHAASAAGPFISETGYRSLCGTPVVMGATVAEAAAIWIQAILAEKKGRVFIKREYRNRDFAAAFSWLPQGEASSPAQYQEPTGQFAFSF